MYCRNCGDEYGPQASYCGKCGCAVNAGTASEVSTTGRPRKPFLRVPLVLGLVLLAVAAACMLMQRQGRNSSPMPYSIGDQFSLTFPDIRLTVADVVEIGDARSAYLKLPVVQDIRGCLTVERDKVTVDFLELGADYIHTIRPPIIVSCDPPSAVQRRAWSGTVQSNASDPGLIFDGEETRAEATIANRKERLRIDGRWIDCTRCDLQLTLHVERMERDVALPIVLWYSPLLGIVRTQERSETYWTKVWQKGHSGEVRRVGISPVFTGAWKTSGPAGDMYIEFRPNYTGAISTDRKSVEFEYTADASRSPMWLTLIGHEDGLTWTNAGIVELSDGEHFRFREGKQGPVMGNGVSTKMRPRSFAKREQGDIVTFEKVSMRQSERSAR